jgi:cellulose synthase/poly-beta-1,6-N-acetylglucosamine synthase-like glycosyltransferase
LNSTGALVDRKFNHESGVGMLSLVSWIMALFAGLLSIPVAVLFVEVVAALPRLTERRLDVSNSGSSKRVAVIVPAHDESTGILPTISDIKSQLGVEDRLVVVADNCSDDTAVVAAGAGAEVIKRDDPEKIGKGYALGWGISFLGPNPPDMVVFVDADCRLQPDTIGKLKFVCCGLQRPVQAAFIMKASESSPINHSLAEFAWIVKNWVRPLGLRNLNCPVQLMGTGMIFPWDAIRSVPLASGNLVEDLKLGLDLAAVGRAPYFFPFATVTSEFPLSAKGTDTQRKRWVYGHIGMIAAVPRLLVLAIARRNFNLLVLTLDLAVPPLSLLGMMTAGMLMLASLAVLFGVAPTAMVIAAANFVAVTLALFMAWLKFGRDKLSVGALASIGPLILQKFNLYGQMLLGRTSAKWIRTDRSRQDDAKIVSRRDR